MKRIRFLPLVLIAVLLVSCQTVTRQDRAVLRAHNVPQDVYDRMLYGDPLSVDDVITLSQRAVPNSLIIHYMYETGCAYRLKKADVKRLRAAGVSGEVISYMQSSAPPYRPSGYAGGYGYPYGNGNGYGYGPDPYFYDYPYYWDYPYLGFYGYGGYYRHGGWGRGWGGRGGGSGGRGGGGGHR
jgi:hypothetical protein